MRRSYRAAAATLVLGLLVSGCTSDSEDSPGPAGQAAAAQSPSAAPSAPTADESPSSDAAATPGPTGSPSSTPEQTADATEQSAEAVPPAGNRVSLPTLMREEWDGGNLQLGEVLNRTDSWTRRYVTYRSDGLTISGTLHVPRGQGNGPFPTVVFAHGHIDLDIYTNGRGLTREQDYLASRGYVVLHTDYRNHASSDDDPRHERDVRLGYTKDVINAVHALRESGLPYVDPDRMALLGRSMGGGVVLNALAVEPGLVDAGIAFASVSSRSWDNFQRWQAGSTVGDQILDDFGSAQDSPRFWRQASPRTYFDRITEPVLMHHGTADSTCPIEWARATQTALRDAGVQSQLKVYEGEEHAFSFEFERSMRRTVAFLEQNLQA